MERLRQQASRGGRPPLGRGDARNFSGDFRNQAPPPDFASSKVGSDDLRRLKSTRSTNQPPSFGPSSMFGSRSSSGRKNLGPGGNLVRGSDDSGASSRTGTPPAGKDRKEDKEAASSINAFRWGLQLCLSPDPPPQFPVLEANVYFLDPALWRAWKTVKTWPPLRHLTRPLLSWRSPDPWLSVSDPNHRPRTVKVQHRRAWKEENAPHDYTPSGKTWTKRRWALPFFLPFFHGLPSSSEAASYFSTIPGY